LDYLYLNKGKHIDFSELNLNEINLTKLRSYARKMRIKSQLHALEYLLT